MIVTPHVEWDIGQSDTLKFVPMTSLQIYDKRIIIRQMSLDLYWKNVNSLTVNLDIQVMWAQLIRFVMHNLEQFV